ncbi:hypothetical protein AMECASPLE_016599 [Ameca splendens]|uniref:Uncharacterized protein n=1 Tax=Ameca splendens TaxID=208324 RepID=A0ABV0ZY05_9TELE
MSVSRLERRKEFSLITFVSAAENTKYLRVAAIFMPMPGSHNFATYCLLVVITYHYNQVLVKTGWEEPKVICFVGIYLSNHYSNSGVKHHPTVEPKNLSF